MKNHKKTTILSVSTAQPGIVAVYADFDGGGGADVEDAVLAWGVVLEEGDDNGHSYSYNFVVPLIFESDMGVLMEASDCENFLGIRGGPLGDNADCIESNRKFYQELILQRASKKNCSNIKI